MNGKEQTGGALVKESICTNAGREITVIFVTIDKVTVIFVVKRVLETDP